MAYEDILKLSEGTHMVKDNGKRCMVVRLQDGFTLITIEADKKMLIQRFSEDAQLLCEDRLDNVFA